MTASEIKQANPLDAYLTKRGVRLVGDGKKKTTNRCATNEHKPGHNCVSVDCEKQVWHCNDCDTGGTVIDWIMMADNKTLPEVLGNGAPQGPPPKKEISICYDYFDEAGQFVYQVVRYVPKDFAQRRPDPSKHGKWIWDMKGCKRVLYNLLAVLNPKNKLIWVVEGEKDANNLMKLGIVATTNVGGAKKWEDSYSDSLKGKDVILCGDNDGDGELHVKKLIECLSEKVNSLRRVIVPAPHKDVSDFIASFIKEDEAGAALGVLVQGALILKEGISPPVARPLNELVRPAQNDASELLRSRYLCRGSGLLFCGPTGIGKSVLVLQAAILWALGRPCFGIEPTQPLKSLIVQAENDDGDMVEIRDGIIAGLQLTEAEAKAACENVLICREDEFCGAAFWGRVRPLLAEHKPDILWIDPALAYIGGEANSQKDVGGFLRNGLNPLLREFNCAAVVVHHTNKPPSGQQKPMWAAGDFAYLGSGSAEWANWARAVLALRSIGAHDFFELHAAKRGARLSWQDDQGQRSFVKHLAHAKEPGVICWREADPDEMPSNGGAPKKYDVEELLALLPPEGLATGEWVKLAKSECGVSESTLHVNRRALKKAGRIAKSSTSGKWQPVTKRERL